MWRLFKGLVSLLVVAALALCGLGALQKPRTTLPPGVAGAYVDIGGVPIRYRQAGQGRDVVLLHGSPGSVEDWDPVFEQLAAGFRVTALDRPGHGYSGGADLPHTPSRNADVVLGVIRALRLQRVVVVGHSYGGSTALALALQGPPEVQALVVAGSRTYPPVGVEPLYRLLALPSLGTGLAAAVAPVIGPRKVEAGARDAFGVNVDLMPPDFVATRLPLWTLPTVSATLSQERVTLDAELRALSPRYPTIRLPVFLLYGTRDATIADGWRLAREIPGARFSELPATGHYVQFARPEAVVRVVEEAVHASEGGKP